MYSSSSSLLTTSLLLIGCSAELCDLSGTWDGGGVSLTVTQTGASYNASAENGAFTNAAGIVYPDNTTHLDCCLAGGITGTISGEYCTRIAWNDGQGSVWTRPPPPIPRNITIHNDSPRLDDTGAIMWLQDGCLANFNGLFYLYGARYQCCPVDEQPACYNPCGWRNTTFAVYSSPDLEVWHLESDSIFPVMENPASPYFNRNTAYFEP